jgi:hypothetical protein
MRAIAQAQSLGQQHQFSHNPHITQTETNKAKTPKTEKQY